MPNGSAYDEVPMHDVVTTRVDGNGLDRSYLDKGLTVDWARTSPALAAIVAPDGVVRFDKPAPAAFRY